MWVHAYNEGNKCLSDGIVNKTYCIWIKVFPITFSVIKKMY